MWGRLSEILDLISMFLIFTKVEVICKHIFVNMLNLNRDVNMHKLIGRTVERIVQFDNCKSLIMKEEKLVSF